MYHNFSSLIDVSKPINVYSSYQQYIINKFENLARVLQTTKNIGDRDKCLQNFVEYFKICAVKYPSAGCRGVIFLLDGILETFPKTLVKYIISKHDIIITPSLINALADETTPNEQTDIIFKKLMELCNIGGEGFYTWLSVFIEKGAGLLISSHDLRKKVWNFILHAPSSVLYSGLHSSIPIFLEHSPRIPVDGRTRNRMETVYLLGYHAQNCIRVKSDACSSFLKALSILTTSEGDLHSLLSISSIFYQLRDCSGGLCVGGHCDKPLLLPRLLQSHNESIFSTSLFLSLTISHTFASNFYCSPCKVNPPPFDQSSSLRDPSLTQTLPHSIFSTLSPYVFSSSSILPSSMLLNPAEYSSHGSTDEIVHGGLVRELVSRMYHVEQPSKVELNEIKREDGWFKASPTNPLSNSSFSHVLFPASSEEHSHAHSHLLLPSTLSVEMNDDLFIARTIGTTVGVSLHSNLLMNNNISHSFSNCLYKAKVIMRNSGVIEESFVMEKEITTKARSSLHSIVSSHPIFSPSLLFPGSATSPFRSDRNHTCVSLWFCLQLLSQPIPSISTSRATSIEILDVLLMLYNQRGKGSSLLDSSSSSSSYITASGLSELEYGTKHSQSSISSSSPSSSGKQAHDGHELHTLIMPNPKHVILFSFPTYYIPPLVTHSDISLLSFTSLLMSFLSYFSISGKGSTAMMYDVCLALRTIIQIHPHFYLCCWRMWVPLVMRIIGEKSAQLSSIHSDHQAMKMQTFGTESSSSEAPLFSPNIGNDLNNINHTIGIASSPLDSSSKYIAGAVSHLTAALGSVLLLCTEYIEGTTNVCESELGTVGNRMDFSSSEEKEEKYRTAREDIGSRKDREDQQRRVCVRFKGTKMSSQSFSCSSSDPSKADSPTSIPFSLSSLPSPAFLRSCALSLSLFVCDSISNVLATQSLSHSLGLISICALSTLFRFVEDTSDSWALKVQHIASRCVKLANPESFLNVSCVIGDNPQNNTSSPLSFELLSLLLSFAHLAPPSFDMIYTLVNRCCPVPLSMFLFPQLSALLPSFEYNMIMGVCESKWNHCANALRCVRECGCLGKEERRSKHKSTIHVVDNKTDPSVSLSSRDYGRYWICSSASSSVQYWTRNESTISCVLSPNEYVAKFVNLLYSIFSVSQNNIKSFRKGSATPSISNSSLRYLGKNGIFLGRAGDDLFDGFKPSISSDREISLDIFDADREEGYEEDFSPHHHKYSSSIDAASSSQKSTPSYDNESGIADASYQKISLSFFSIMCFALDIVQADNINMKHIPSWGYIETKTDSMSSTTEKDEEEMSTKLSNLSPEWIISMFFTSPIILRFVTDRRMCQYATDKKMISSFSMIKKKVILGIQTMHLYSRIFSACSESFCDILGAVWLSSFAFITCGELSKQEMISLTPPLLTFTSSSSAVKDAGGVYDSSPQKEEEDEVDEETKKEIEQNGTSDSTQASLYTSPETSQIYGTAFARQRIMVAVSHLFHIHSCSSCVLNPLSIYSYPCINWSFAHIGSLCHRCASFERKQSDSHPSLALFNIPMESSNLLYNSSFSSTFYSSLLSCCLCECIHLHPSSKKDVESISRLICKYRMCLTVEGCSNVRNLMARVMLSLFREDWKEREKYSREHALSPFPAGIMPTNMVFPMAESSDNPMDPGIVAIPSSVSPHVPENTRSAVEWLFSTIVEIAGHCVVKMAKKVVKDVGAGVDIRIRKEQSAHTAMDEGDEEREGEEIEEFSMSKQTFANIHFLEFSKLLCYIHILHGASSVISGCKRPVDGIILSFYMIIRVLLQMQFKSNLTIKQTDLLVKKLPIDIADDCTFFSRVNALNYDYRVINCHSMFNWLTYFSSASIQKFNDDRDVFRTLQWTFRTTMWMFFDMIKQSLQRVFDATLKLSPSDNSVAQEINEAAIKEWNNVFDTMFMMQEGKGSLRDVINSFLQHNISSRFMECKILLLATCGFRPQLVSKADKMCVPLWMSVSQSKDGLKQTGMRKLRGRDADLVSQSSISGQSQLSLPWDPTQIIRDQLAFGRKEEGSVESFLKRVRKDPGSQDLMRRGLFDRYSSIVLDGGCVCQGNRGEECTISASAYGSSHKQILKHPLVVASLITPPPLSFFPFCHSSHHSSPGFSFSPSLFSSNFARFLHCPPLPMRVDWVKHVAKLPLTESGAILVWIEEKVRERMNTLRQEVSSQLWDDEIFLLNQRGEDTMLISRCVCICGVYLNCIKKTTVRGPQILLMVWRLVCCCVVCIEFLRLTVEYWCEQQTHMLRRRVKRRMKEDNLLSSSFSTYVFNNQSSQLSSSKSSKSTPHPQSSAFLADNSGSGLTSSVCSLHSNSHLVSFHIDEACGLLSELLRV
ncbi:hypothetical protein ADUPG1_012007, partial [Aduncisulcus paluster]